MALKQPVIGDVWVSHMTAEPSLIAPAQQRAAKVAGLAYLLPVVFVLVANFGIRGGLYVTGDFAETVRRMTAAEPMLRLSIAFDVTYAVGVVILLTALYIVLSPVSKHAALAATLLKLVYAGTAMLMALSFTTVARLTSDPAYLQAMGEAPFQALVRIHSSTTADEYYIGLAFWSVSATLIGWLWLKSRYIPRALAVFGLLSAAWCTFCAFAYLANPGFKNVVNLWAFDTPLALFDITISFWLLFKGLRTPSVA